MNKVLHCDGLAREFTVGPEKVHVLRGLDFELLQGELVAIVGSSGSGKTTLLNLLAGLDNPSAGQIVIQNKNLSKMAEAERSRFRNQHMGFVFQFHHLLPEFTALENLLLPAIIGGCFSDKVTEKARSLLERVGLANRMGHKPSELSGGERQRVAIARALVNEPGLVLMDEPTGNLDEENSRQIKSLIVELNKEHATSFILVTHSSDMSAAMDKSYRLVEGRLEQI